MTRLLALTTLFLLGCEPVEALAVDAGTVDAGTVDAGTVDAGVTDAGTGFPCDVREVLQTKCAGCHSSVSYATHFKSRDDFHGVKEGVRFGELAVRRMNDVTQPMPPDGVLAPGLREVISKWVTDGMPAGECADLDE